MIIRESYLSKIRPFIGKDIIKVLTGIRRGGKSVLLEQIRDEINSPNTIFLNFEDLGIYVNITLYTNMYVIKSAAARRLSTYFSMKSRKCRAGRRQ